MMENTFEGKITIITGGAQGIGKAAAEKFALLGAKIIIWDINAGKGKETVSRLNSKGYEAIVMEVDTTKFPSVESAAKEVFEKYGRIDILINNAGITRDAAAMNMTVAQWQQVIDINLTAVFNCTKAVAPYMKEQKYGRIINTSSLAGIFSNHGQTNYTATKSGLVGITKVWARELSRYGITVNAVAPGFIETDNLSEFPEKILQSIKEKIPVGRLGNCEDVANVYLFLASENSSYISGSVISVDGGYVS